MNKLIVVLGYSRLSTEVKVDYAKFIVESMTDNPFFDEPTIPLKQILQKAEQVEERYLASRDSSKKETQLMYQAEYELSIMLDYIVAYVQYIARQNIEKGAEIVYSAGMHVKRKGKSARKFKVENTLKYGTVKLLTKGEGKSTAYNWEYSSDQLEWKLSHITTIASTTIDDLIPGTKYYFRVSVTKRQQTGAYSDVVAIIVT